MPLKYMLLIDVPVYVCLVELVLLTRTTCTSMKLGKQNQRYISWLGPEADGSADTLASAFIHWHLLS